jgi:hypothetical protein
MLGGEPMNLQVTHLRSILASDPGVDSNYRHRPKRVAPGAPVEIKGALLKWYAINYDEDPVPSELTQLARTYLERTPLGARGMGFVLLHRCGKDFYFLIVCTWRDNNEIWQTVFYKDGDKMADFALFPREQPHKGTFCVWELVPTWHEQGAWLRFLNSPRD